MFTVSTSTPRSNSLRSGFATSRPWDSSGQGHPQPSCSQPAGPAFLLAASDAAVSSFLKHLSPSGSAHVPTTSRLLSLLSQAAFGGRLPLKARVPQAPCRMHSACITPTLTTSVIRTLANPNLYTPSLLLYLSPSHLSSPSLDCTYRKHPRDL